MNKSKCKLKGKAVPTPKLHAMKKVWGSGCKAQYIFNLVIRQRWMVSFMLWL